MLSAREKRLRICISIFLGMYFLVFALVQVRPIVEPLRAYWNHPLFPRLHTMIFVPFVKKQKNLAAKVAYLDGSERLFQLGQAGDVAYSAELELVVARYFLQNTLGSSLGIFFGVNIYRGAENYLDKRIYLSLARHIASIGCKQNLNNATPRFVSLILIEGAEGAGEKIRHLPGGSVDCF